MPSQYVCSTRKRLGSGLAARHTTMQQQLVCRQVWWPLDSAFYTGVITAFHPLEHKHTVAYEDGDIEHIQLWAPDQEVYKLCS